MVSAVKRGGRTLVCVTLKAPNDWSDHKKLYEYGFSLYSETEVKSESIALLVVNSEKTKVVASAREPLKILAREGEEIKVKTQIRPFEYAPVYSGQIVGRVAVLADGFEVFKTELVLTESAHAKGEKIKIEPKNLFEKFAEWLRSLFE